MLRFSILDLCPIPEGGTAADAFRHSLDLAQHAEAWGYERFWLAEHHNMPGIASAATSVVIGHVAAGTKTIRVGSGGVMLPNHSPLVIAEQFGTLATLFPDRIDLGLGRAPGTDPMTARALRRDIADRRRSLSSGRGGTSELLPTCAAGTKSTRGSGLGIKRADLAARLQPIQRTLAAQLGLPFAFASHFAPADLMEAIYLYRNQFKPSAELRSPIPDGGRQRGCGRHGSEALAPFHVTATGVCQSSSRVRRAALPPPIEDIGEYASPMELAMIDQALSCSVRGVGGIGDAGASSTLWPGPRRTN